ncbi:MAG: flagellar basal body-associated FliL family protein [Hydrogenophaga sp.]|uniref:flagellar basal body-associated FliL family protein n=1 Tax=Hydrogenophaga sp. TaxID=1904254 RepID=UPI00271B6B48|nr:flagellar basal body-associated FliL family protein [Hydrogenophaga sp.]MDO9033473.1 flagellar basal body-associated FliL family protein [Hydrogenophaga sp.]
MSAAAAPANPAADATAAKPKSKKLLFIIVGVVVLALLAAGAALFVLKQNTADHEGDEDGAVAEQNSHDPKTPPTFLPLDSMVVNLADPGGNRFIQTSITLQLQDAQTGEDLKVYMPTIRNGILIQISQRTADEILTIQGKEKLATDIMGEIATVMGYETAQPGAEGAAGKKKRNKAAANPVQGVLFSSFIVQ